MTEADLQKEVEETAAALRGLTPKPIWVSPSPWQKMRVHVAGAAYIFGMTPASLNTARGDYRRIHYEVPYLKTRCGVSYLLADCVTFMDQLKVEVVTPGKFAGSKR